MTSTWTDTTGVAKPPTDNPWRAARWLVGRYPRMQVLCERVGAIDDDEGGRWPHVDMLADIIRASDAYDRAWDRYRRSRYEPRPRSGESDEAYEARGLAWTEAGPHPSTYVAEFELATVSGVLEYGLMSSGERKMLRVLATIGPHRVEFSATSDTVGLDDEGHAFIRDWALVVLTG